MGENSKGLTPKEFLQFISPSKYGRIIEEELRSGKFSISEYKENFRDFYQKMREKIKKDQLFEALSHKKKLLNTLINDRRLFNGVSFKVDYN